ncbi:MAG: hypothetical protein PQJ58_01930, partial [Spirochaetales bacterium]|nr:hypothetical protein [Spirochaetales bacterium]
MINRNHLERYKNNNKKNLDFVDYIIGSFVEQLYNDIEHAIYNLEPHIAKNPELTKYLNKKHGKWIYNLSEEELFMQQFFHNFHTQRNEVESIYYADLKAGYVKSPYLNNQDIEALIGEEDVFNYDPRVQPWFVRAMVNPHEIIITDSYLQTKDNLIICGAKAILIDNQPVGVLCIDLVIQKFTNVINIINDIDSVDFGIIQNETLLYSKEGDLNIVNLANHSLPWREQLEYFSGYGYTKTKWNNIMTKTSEKLGWEYYFSTPNYIINNSIKNILFPLLYFFIFIITFLIIAYKLSVTFLILNPINQIRFFAESQTNEEMIDNIMIRNDKIGSLATSFNEVYFNNLVYNKEIESLVGKINY